MISFMSLIFLILFFPEWHFEDINFEFFLYFYGYGTTVARYGTGTVQTNTSTSKTDSRNDSYGTESKIWNMHCLIYFIVYR